MPPKAVKDASVFSLVTAWMKPKAEPPNAEQTMTDDKTPTPPEVAESSQGSPTELVHSTAFDYETYFEQNGARTGGNDDGSDDDDGVATDEAAAMAELVQEASLANTTLQVLLEIKRKREDSEPEPAESEAELV